jgi:hypothetical protein
MPSQTRLEEATTLKSRGNALFAEPELDGALAAYLEALKLLPETTPVSKPPPPPPTGVEELTDEQAAVLENEIRARELESSRPDAVTRRSLERQIDDARKALWSNIGAVYVKKVSNTNQPRPMAMPTTNVLHRATTRRPSTRVPRVSSMPPVRSPR